MRSVKIAIIGAGVMGQAITRIIIENGYKPEDVSVRDKDKVKSRLLRDKYGIEKESITDSDVVILAVKPQDLKVTSRETRLELKNSALIVSVLAGIRTAEIQQYLGKHVRIVRIMPNTPLMVGEGMSVIARGKTATDTDLNLVNKIFSSSGKTLVVREDLMDAVTAVSGSGPAYFYGFVEAMLKAAEKLGLSEQDSKLLVSQTFIGAAKMLQESGKDAVALRKEVTSPNGTTAAALSIFDSNGLEDLVYKAMKAARDRSQELSN